VKVLVERVADIRSNGVDGASTWASEWQGYNVLFLDFVHRVTDISTLNHYVSETGSPSVFRQVARCTRWTISNIRRLYLYVGPPLWSSGQSFWLQIQRSRVRSPALPDFLSSSEVN